jgi:arabinan endo-1,5-alpha-L-arabinosidase
MKIRALTATLFLSAIITATWTADAAAQTNPPTTRASNTSGATGSHDPSRMTLCDGKYYVYSTGGGMKYSSDQVTWTSGPSPFAAVTPTTSPATAPARGRGGRGATPASVRAIVPQDRGIWAPDVIFHNNKYYLYYCVAAPLTVSHCAIGLLTSPTLDPSSPNYKWTDAGVVLSTWNKVVKRSAIDPCPFVDANGDLWMSWGSGYANGSAGDDPTIIISKLDNATGLLSTTDTTEYPVAPGHTEGSFVYYRSGFYYAFWNDGGSGPPPNATYRIHVARSKTVTGPYLDKAGNAGASDIFIKTVKQQDSRARGRWESKASLE